jgi:hypothetical protein
MPWFRAENFWFGASKAVGGILGGAAVGALVVWTLPTVPAYFALAGLSAYGGWEIGKGFDIAINGNEVGGLFGKSWGRDYNNAQRSECLGASTMGLLTLLSTLHPWTRRGSTATDDVNTGIGDVAYMEKSQWQRLRYDMGQVTKGAGRAGQDSALPMEQRGMGGMNPLELRVTWKFGASSALRFGMAVSMSGASHGDQVIAWYLSLDQAVRGR